MTHKYELFKFDIIKESDSDILIKGFKLTEKTGTHYREMSMYISPVSIPDILKVITNKELIANRNFSKGEISPYNFKNKFDEIKFSYMGSDQEPILNIRNIKHVFKDGNTDEYSSISIPLNFFPGSNEDMEYLLPLAEELKKYI